MGDSMGRINSHLLSHFPPLLIYQLLLHSLHRFKILLARRPTRALRMLQFLRQGQVRAYLPPHYLLLASVQTAYPRMPLSFQVRRKF
jgi:hypothetical protein